MRYFLRALAFAALRGWRITPRYLAILAGRTLGGSIARLLGPRP